MTALHTLGITERDYSPAIIRSEIKRPGYSRYQKSCN